jgi:uncharacterized membrane protein
MIFLSRRIHLKRFLNILTFFILATLLAGLLPQTGTLAADAPVVHAVLFYSPTCGHCEQVITQDLPPLFEKYQDQLQIIGIDVTTSGGQALYQSAIEGFQITEDRLGVPTLIVGDVVMVGSDEIPTMFPALIEQGLASGGIPWPEITGLAETIAAEAPPSEQEIEQAAQVESLTLPERFALDPLANTLAVITLIGMLLSVVLIGINFSKIPANGPRLWPNWVVPVLLLVGSFAAGYLTYVEVTDTTAICGPIGNCNLVQQSTYAKLFGILPVGVLGLVGYLAILLAWLVVQLGKPQSRRIAGLALWVFAWFGTLFSIYLTFLEPFVIGATCAWCLTSAIIMTLLLVVTTPIAQKQILKGGKSFRRIQPPASPVEG